ncbi:hypothetical protein RhiirC2_797003 [Rhizophagus irregularis]|uniref:Protein far1-related sequence 5-like n=1 Tax=Rhizophagus irregularis TaxID=588596 RepID=A0A2N1M8P7_9GLOM|nr:hypothetical protein RhiirC2_797003 [Rhizophagus irregularis]
MTDESIGESIGDIKVGDSFSTWDDAEIKLNQYAKFAGFSLRKKRVEADKDGVVRRRTFECSFSGKPVSNQVIDIIHQRERASKKIMCPWHINLTKPKSSIEIGITSIIKQHNHSMIADAQLYIPKYRRLSDNVIEKINFYVTKENMGAKQIYPLLVADNTCRTNWFDMYLTFLVIIDNNTKSHLVAQCLSEDETIESYEWFLDCFLQATNDNPPVCLFSDADPALGHARNHVIMLN